MHLLFFVQVLPKVVVCQEGAHQYIAVQVTGVGLASADTTILARCHGHYLQVQVCSSPKLSLGLTLLSMSYYCLNAPQGRNHPDTAIGEQSHCAVVRHRWRVSRARVTSPC